MKKLLAIAIIVLGLLFSGNVSNAGDVTVIVKNKIDKNIVIKRTKPTKEQATQSALEGCYVLYKFREDLKKKKRKEMMNACYVVEDNQNVSWSKSCNKIVADAKNNWARSWIRGTICNNNSTGSLKKLEMKCAKKAARKKTDIDAKKTWNKCYY